MHHVRPSIFKPDGKRKSGRGFSLEELRKAGLTLAETRIMKIPVDPRRKTAHNENVEAVKAHAKKYKAEIKPVSKPEPKPGTKDKKEKPKK